MPGARLAGRRILVVEDDPRLRARILRVLRLEGARARAVGSGERAVELVMAGARFDVALVDLALPGMDGAECARLLRALPRSVRGGRVETLVGTSADAARLGAPGDAFDGTLAKPFSATALLDELERLGVVRRPDPTAPEDC